MATKKAKKETGIKQPELHEIIAALDQYREQLHVSSTVSSTKFSHMQHAIHGCKNIVRDLYGAKRKSEVAWVK